MLGINRYIMSYEKNIYYIPHYYNQQSHTFLLLFELITKFDDI